MKTRRTADAEGDTDEHSDHHDDQTNRRSNYRSYGGRSSGRRERVTRSQVIVINLSGSESDDGGLGSLAPKRERRHLPIRSVRSRIRNSQSSGHSLRSHSSRRHSPASGYPLRSRESNRRTNSEVKEEYEEYNETPEISLANNSAHDEEDDEEEIRRPPSRSRKSRVRPVRPSGLARELNNLQQLAKENYGSDFGEQEMSLHDRVKARSRRSQSMREERRRQEEEEQNEEQMDDDDENGDEDDEEGEEEEDEEEEEEEEEQDQEEHGSRYPRRTRRQRIVPERYGQQRKNITITRSSTRSGSRRAPEISIRRSSSAPKKNRQARSYQWDFRKKKDRKAHESDDSSSSSDEEHFQKKKRREMERSRNTMLPMNLNMKDANHRHGFRDRERIGASLADVDPMDFDKSITFSSVGGHPDAIRQLKEMVVLPMLYPNVFEKFSVQPPRGVLFYGPPGTGKTLMARALANECSQDGKKMAFFMRKGSDVLSKWVGESERQLRLLFDQAYRMRPSIIFFDEIDGLAPVRSSKQDHIHSSIVSTLLALMDGLDSRGEVIVIGATNRVDAIDPALRRPGRFDREILFPLPSAEARMQILKIHAKKWEAKPEDSFFRRLSLKTTGYCGADLKALFTDAVLNALRRTYPAVYRTTQKIDVNLGNITPAEEDFENAMKTIVPSSVRSDSSAAVPLDAHCKPLLIGKFNELLEHVGNLWPHVKLKNSSSNRTDRTIFDQPSSSKDEFLIFEPRLLIKGMPDNGQNLLAQALLDSMDSFKIIKVTLPALFACSTRTVEDTLAEMLREASRAGKAVLYIPDIDSLWRALSEVCRGILISMIKSMPYSQPTYLIFTSSANPSSMKDDTPSEITDLLKSPDNTYTAALPSSTELTNFFAKIKDSCLIAPKSFAAEAQNILKPSFYVEVKKDEKVLTQEEVDKVEQKEERILSKGSDPRDSRFKEFVDPVDPDELPDYHEVIKNPMDLTTMMCKIDAHEYQTVKEFLSDVKLMCANALEYNPITYQEERMIRHRACLAVDVAHEYVETELDPEFETVCEQIKVARALRGSEKKKFAPDYVEIPKTTPEELAEQQNEIKNREIKNEFEDGEEIWCLHSDDNKFYIGRLNRTNHEMHPDAPFYVHYVVDITKRYTVWAPASRIRYRLTTDNITDNVKLTISKRKRKRKSNWASGIIKRRSTRRSMVENDEMIDADETTREFDEETRQSMFDNCENSNDSNKENVPVAPVATTALEEKQPTVSFMSTRRSFEQSKMDVDTPSTTKTATNLDASQKQATPEKAAESSPAPSKKVNLEDIWSAEELALIRSEAEKQPKPVEIDEHALEKIFQMAVDVSSGKVVKDVMRVGAALNTVIYRYKDQSDRRKLPEDLQQVLKIHS
ncbi:Oidioi.mRNA.OKI2018_I69.PAR.g9333.t1.cds [Oikopleura dioica]|uniref:Oidioi.mRNA.OKI2018_I69.PAR.g9333.t1.cds n=1 Tax=Oikopleura dioica TaxID=34765 RepID=A0ABN7RL35_OIKDI|nr:Oidioi.mRNA.OKI2018_I69.PAR.g9333.t1.cds [Oikopleura dioica]